jgi:hypothetical protein
MFSFAAAMVLVLPKRGAFRSVKLAVPVPISPFKAGLGFGWMLASSSELVQREGPVVIGIAMVFGMVETLCLNHTGAEAESEQQGENGFDFHRMDDGLTVH